MSLYRKLSLSAVITAAALSSNVYVSLAAPTVVNGGQQSAAVRSVNGSPSADFTSSAMTANTSPAEPLSNSVSSPAPKSASNPATDSVSSPAPKSASGLASQPTADPAADIARMYLVKHEMKISLAGAGATLDGKNITTAKPIRKNGRVYVPLRTLSQSGAVTSVSWNGKQQQVRVIANTKINPGLQELYFRIGSDRVYEASGKALPAEYYTLPKPFLANGVAYVPVRALSWLGLSVTEADGQIIWKWSEKNTELLLSSWETDQAQTTFTVLYQKEQYTPGLMTLRGPDFWSGQFGGSKVVDKDITVDGRLYNRIQFTTQLRPGINPLQVGMIGAAYGSFSVTRNVSDPASVPLQLTEEGKLYLTLTSPANGYQRVKAGEAFTVAGSVANPHQLNFDKTTVTVHQYIPSVEGSGNKVYKLIDTRELPIQNGEFTGTVKLEQAGSYWISVHSPKYIHDFPGMDSAATSWADFIVRVE